MRNITIYGSIIILLILTFSLIPTNASKIDETVNNNDQNAILLKNAQFITTDYTLQTVQSEQVLSSFPDDTDGYYIVQSTSYVTDEWKQSITDTGAVLFDYIPNNAFIVRMNSRVLARVEALDTVQWIGIYQPYYKISNGLSGSYSTCSNAEQSIYTNITVLLFDAQDSILISNEIQALGGIITDNAEDTLQVRIESSKIADIAAIPGVCWIEKLSRFVILNDVAANITNVYETRNTYGLNGSGQIVAVADTGLDTGVNDASMHDDFEGRIIEIYDTAGDNNASDVYSGHGTHIAGSVLGDGSCSNGQFKGMAPQAELIFQAAGFSNDWLNIPNGLNDLFLQAYDEGARIHTNSWGSEEEIYYGTYTSESQIVDDFMWNHPDMLILMAAGNGGVDSDSNGIIDLDSICSPATAKNCISVGSSENIRSNKLDNYSTLNNGNTRFPSYPINSDEMANNTEGLAAFSSRGPTDDGRIKPDVVAPGTYIISIKSSKAKSTMGYGDYDANYTYGSGTSMSTPIVAGTAALIRQYYMQNESITPTAALLKATIINGAYNMVPGQYGIGQYKEIQTRPDNASGWGRIDIENSLFPASPRIMQYHDNISLNTSESWNAKYYSNNNSEPLQITLVWTDHPAIPSAAKTLVNNLDLTVVGPAGTYLGNGGDAINNVEQVELLTPVDGIYNITITGADIPHPPQPFALVISGALDLPPTISGEFPANNSYTGNNTTLVCVDITDTGSPVNESSINMTINGELVNITTTSITNGFMVQNQTVTPYNENIVTCSINASDINLNHRTYSWSFTVDIIDPTSNTPNDVNYIAGSTVNFTNWILYDQHPGYYRVLQNGTQIVESTLWSDNTNITVPVNTNAGIGVFNYTIQYNDSAGNSGQDTVNITITDKTPPVLSDNTPATGTTDLTPPTISIKATDGGTYVNASSANMTVDGMQVVLTHTSSGITYTFSNDTTTTYNHGDTINVTFSVSDNAGHISNKSWMFYIDNVAPMISITSPANNSPTSGSSITVSGTVNGTGSPPDITVTNSTGIDTTLTDFSASVPLLMGVNIIYANVSDQAGNTNTSFINITRIEPVVSSSSGGGGSSFGSGSSEAYENIEAKETQRVFVSKYNQIEFLFEKNENDIEYIKYRALKNTGTVSATIETLKDTSTIAGQPPSGIVYKNINMWVGKKGYATEKNMENPVIGFKVEKKWIESNDLEHGSITLKRYYNDEWIPLPTSKTNESASYIYFESQTSGFSPFAITGPKKLQNPSSSPQSPEDDASIDETPSTQEDPEEEGSISDKIFSINGVGANGSLCMLAILAGILIYNRKGKESI
ncbi:MAG: PGF-pre-PGF domain-containing protein [Methanosarcinales archaeon]|nr:PGF-pre-PGF domain-containing protein [Methanosarcinales archaeon]